MTIVTASCKFHHDPTWHSYSLVTTPVEIRKLQLLVFRCRTQYIRKCMYTDWSIILLVFVKGMSNTYFFYLCERIKLTLLMTIVDDDCIQILAIMLDLCQLSLLTFWYVFSFRMRLNIAMSWKKLHPIHSWNVQATQQPWYAVYMFLLLQLDRLLQSQMLLWIDWWF